MIGNIRVRWMFFKHDMGVRRDKALMKLAWALPQRLVMWAFVRVTAHATAGEYGNTNPTELGVMDALKRWPAN